MTYGIEMMLHGGTGIKVEVVLFDLDGTLLDSTSQISDAVALTRQKLQLPPANMKYLHSVIGMPAEYLFGDLSLQDNEIEFAVKNFRMFLENLKLDATDLFESSTELLYSLRTKGIRLAVATNKPSHLATKALLDSGILGYFDFTVGAEDLPHKPSPAILNRAIELLNSKPQVALMVGDRLEDIYAAKAAGVHSFGIAQGPHTFAELLNAGAKRVFPSILEFNLALKGNKLNEFI
jgi:phosphoglycolate phosphatase